MRPAFSVILFTVLSGAGLGVLAWTALLDLGAWIGWVPGTPPQGLALVAAAGVVLVSVGLGASALHLANPRSAWRSLVRWRTSWLSREAAAALLLLPMAALYAVSLWQRWGSPRLLLAVLVVALAWMMLVATAMIYASLKPIRQWHTRRVPIALFLMGHACGALVLLALLPSDAAARRGMAYAAAATLLAAALAKLEYWLFVDRGTGSVTLEQALGVAHGVRPPGPPRSVMAARLLDVGHSRGTYLTREFITTLTPAWARTLRIVALATGFLIPAAWITAGNSDVASAGWALAACMIGLTAERWLFFAEARHTVRLYHGEART
jgi:DMSO reductase anchor subunit